MVALTLEDLTGNIEVIVFPQLYANNWREITEDNIIIIMGRLSNQDDQIKILAEEITLPGKKSQEDNLTQKSSAEITIKFNDYKHAESKLTELFKTIKKRPGTFSLILFLELAKENKNLKLHETFLVESLPDIIHFIEKNYTVTKCKLE
jgi:DNA polymerase-3 subunit alpha